MNISSLCHNFYDLHIHLARKNVKFNIISIAETKLKKYTVGNIPKWIWINLNGYAIEHTPTEANCGGVFLRINNSLNSTVRTTLQYI